MQKVVQYIEHHKLFSPDDKILVALSGGADSVALLRLLLSLGYAQGTGSWDAVKTAYVDGWATEYAAANEG